MDTQERQIVVFDTTLRDGEQAPGFHMTPTQKLEIARSLSDLNVDVIEAGFPVSSPADFDAVEKISKYVGQEINSPEICGLARCVKEDIDAVWKATRSARYPRIHVFIASSDIHMEKKLKMSRSEVVKRAVSSVRYASQIASHVQFSAEDASRADRDFLSELVHEVIEAGATTINLPDTVGYTIPDHFFSLITHIKSSVSNIGKAKLSVHCHDDLGLAVANTLAAVKAGADQIECTINGIGERAGNCSLEEVVMALRVHSTFYMAGTRINHKNIYPVSRSVSDTVHVSVPPNKAIVGENAFAHSSGVHQDGVIKNKSTYEIIDPEDVGAPHSQIVLTARSGRRALQFKLKELGYEIQGDRLEKFFYKFKELADQKRFVASTDLTQMLTD
jgi:2-isopropylmalate synthase